MQLELADTSFNWLKNFMHEVNNQDCRMTAKPIYFELQAKDEEDSYEPRQPFLTEKAANAHIKANRYKYKDPRTYVKHFYRNSEMEQLYKILNELVGVHILKG